MASNPPFHVEDQTDEDFFDKLEKDDVEPVNCGHDDVKSIANSGIGDDARESGTEHKREEEDVKLDGGNAQEESSLGDDSAIDHGDYGMGSENASTSSLSNSNGISNSEVKEVGWNSFYADSNENVGFGSYSDFFTELGDQSGKPCHHSNNEVKPGTEILNDGLNSSANYVQYQEGQGYDANGQDLSSTQYWENLYPGWKYDHNTGQWYQVDDHNATRGSNEANTIADWTTTSDAKAKVSYMQQTMQSVAGTNLAESLSSWNQVSQENNGYPKHMVFDPQYPGWYYDMIAKEWLSLENYHSFIHSASHGHESGHDFTSTETYGSWGAGSQAVDDRWSGSYGINHQQGLYPYKTETTSRSGDNTTSSGNQQLDHSFGSMNHDHDLANETLEMQSFAPSGNVAQHFNYSNTQFDGPNNFSNEYAKSQKSFTYSQAQQSFQGGDQYSYAQHAGRSSAGRPPHALVTFGFGGKLIVMKDSNFSSSPYGSQTTVQSSVSVLNLMEVVASNIDSSNIGNGTGDYFRALCRQSFPGPLVGGSVGSKELYKWIDERIAHCGSTDTDYKKGERLRLLLYLLRIACQHYGKLRSPFGTNTILRENDIPELAVAKLFASAKTSSRDFNQYAMLSHCLQNLPSEAQMRATASEVQNLLVSGKKREALRYAQEGQLWGPALVLASQLGDQFYADTVKQMALRQLVSGSPLRTLCLLIAGQPAEVFSCDNSVRGDLSAFSMPQQPTQEIEKNISDSENDDTLRTLMKMGYKQEEALIAIERLGKVHGSLARAGKVRGQTPKVAKQDKKKKPRGRAHKRMQYNRRFVTAVVGFGKKRGPNSSEK
uniref:Protein transport protein sec16 n=1 Tax=Cajanus cajan TaxID=3821 RepID=A0A151SKI7_CAJCA|nr:40S ribosomal protein S30 [Cajanus cajan]